MSAAISGTAILALAPLQRRTAARPRRPARIDREAVHRVGGKRDEPAACAGSTAAAATMTDGVRRVARRSRNRVSIVLRARSVRTSQLLGRGRRRLPSRASRSWRGTIPASSDERHACRAGTPQRMLVAPRMPLTIGLSARPTSDAVVSKPKPAPRADAGNDAARRGVGRGRRDADGQPEDRRRDQEQPRGVRQRRSRRARRPPRRRCAAGDDAPRRRAAQQRAADVMPDRPAAAAIENSSPRPAARAPAASPARRRTAAAPDRSCDRRTAGRRSTTISRMKFSNASTFRNVTPRGRCRCARSCVRVALVVHHEHQDERDRRRTPRSRGTRAAGPTICATAPPTIGPIAGPEALRRLDGPDRVGHRGRAAPSRPPSSASARRSRRRAPAPRAARTRATGASRTPSPPITKMKLTSDRSTMILRP